MNGNLQYCAQMLVFIFLCVCVCVYVGVHVGARGPHWISFCITLNHISWNIVSDWIQYSLIRLGGLTGRGIGGAPVPSPSLLSPMPSPGVTHRPLRPAFKWVLGTQAQVFVFVHKETFPLYFPSALLSCLRDTYISISCFLERLSVSSEQFCVIDNTETHLNLLCLWSYFHQPPIWTNLCRAGFIWTLMLTVDRTRGLPILYWSLWIMVQSQLRWQVSEIPGVMI